MLFSLPAILVFTRHPVPLTPVCVCVGLQACIKGAVEHANNRTQFGRKLKDFGLIKVCELTVPFAPIA